MNLDLIRKRLSGEFRPFVIRTSDGREYPIREPFTVLVAPRILEVLDAGGHIVRVDPLHVVALVDLPAPPVEAPQR